MTSGRDRHRGGQTDKEKDRHAERARVTRTVQTQRQADRESKGHKDRQRGTDRQTERARVTRTDTERGRQTDRESEGHKDRHREGQTDRPREQGSQGQTQRGTNKPKEARERTRETCKQLVVGF